MATTKDITNLVINKVESQAVYNYMENKGLINEDELYFVEATEEDTLEFDDALNDESDNAVKNRVIKAKFDEIASVYDTLQEAVDGKADSEHEHNATDITSGTLIEDVLPVVPIEKGGTGSSDAETARANLGITPENIGAATVDHIHEDIYYTKDEIDGNFSDVDELISDIIDGTTPVAEAGHASSADTATTSGTAEKAIQDENGDAIASTYETKDESSAKLDEAKSYTDTVGNSKQDKLSGSQGQVVGFDESGNAVAQDMPDSYLKHVYQSATLPTNSDWTGIAYGNNMFVAISESGKVVCSNNKLDWMPSILPECEWKDVAYGGGKFVAVGRDKIAYSTDGIDWVEVTSQAISQMEYPYYYSIGYGNDKFIIFEQNEARIAYSENGIDWSITESLDTSPIENDTFTAIVYGEDKFVSISNNSGSIYFSEDGLNWNKAEGIPPAALMDIVYDDGKFVTIGHSYISEYVVVFYSEDGINWSDVAIYLDDNYQSVTFWSISYGNGKFVAIGSGSQIDEIGMATEIIIFAYSVNGVDWTIDSIPFIEEDGMYFVYNNMTYGGDKFVAVPTYGTRALSSTDGINWYTEYNELEQNGDIVTGNVKKIFNECLPVGNPGDFVVIGENGDLVAKTISYAEGASF